MSRLIFNPEADKAIVDAWPEVAILPGFYPAQIKARAYRLGLRHTPAERRRRYKKGGKS